MEKSKQTKPDLGIWAAPAAETVAPENFTTPTKSHHPQYQNLNKKKKPAWGLRNVIYSFLAFLAVQVVVSIAVLAYVLAQSGLANLETMDPNTLTQKTTEALSKPLILIAAQFSMYLTWLAFMWFATWYRGRKSFTKDFWLKFRWYDPLLGAVIAWGLIAAENFILWVLPVLFPHLNMAGTDNGKELTSQTGIYFAVIGIGIGGIAGPFFEELFFRGFVMQGLIRYFRKGLRTQPTSRLGYNTQKNNPRVYNAYLGFKHWLYTHKYVLSVIISSIVFGSLHWQGTDSFGQILVPILTGLIGVVLALVALKTRRLGLGIFIHIFFNSTTIILSLFM